MSDFIDEIMDFNAEDLAVFNEPETKSYDANIYKTNPSKSVASNGHYMSRIRVIYNPFDIKKSIVNQANYAMYDTSGFFMVRSKLANGDKSCPLFTAWKQLWFSGDDAKKEWAKKFYDKSESQWVLVQILEDENQPEMVGQFKVMKLPRVVYDKMMAKMNPSPESKKQPEPIMDYLFGPALDMDVTPGPDDPQNPSRKQREISYSLCDFDKDFEPVIKVDGTPLFTDAEIETMETYATAKVDMVKGKTNAKKEEAKKKMESMYEDIKKLYVKAFNYVKENAVDLVEECEYKEWDDFTTDRVNKWIAVVAAMKDPKITPYESLGLGGSEPSPGAKPVQPAKPKELPDDAIADPMADAMGISSDDDLPF